MRNISRVTVAGIVGAAALAVAAPADAMVAPMGSLRPTYEMRNGHPVSMRYLEGTGYVRYDGSNRPRWTRKARCGTGRLASYPNGVRCGLLRRG